VQLFGRGDVLRIKKYWKYGGVEIIPVRHVNVGYLMKYIQKALDVVSEDFYKIRRIGSSLIPAWLRQSWNDLTTAMNVFRIWSRKIEDMALLT
jgi:hypothetical protein